MKHLKLFEEYRHFKVWPSKKNIKDPDEPFFNDKKYDYKMKRQIFGSNDFLKYKNRKPIEIDNDVIDELLNIGGMGKNINIILTKIKTYTFEYNEYMNGYEKDISSTSPRNSIGYPDSSLIFYNLENEDVIKLMQIGFDVYVYDDSNEYSEEFGDKFRVIWTWK